MFKKLFPYVLFLLIFDIGLPLVADSSNDILGLWLTEGERGKIEIYQCGTNSTNGPKFCKEPHKGRV